MTEDCDDLSAAEDRFLTACARKRLSPETVRGLLGFFEDNDEDLLLMSEWLDSKDSVGEYDLVELMRLVTLGERPPAEEQPTKTIEEAVADLEREYKLLKRDHREAIEEGWPGAYKYEAWEKKTLAAIIHARSVLKQNGSGSHF